MHPAAAAETICEGMSCFCLVFLFCNVCVCAETVACHRVYLFVTCTAIVCSHMIEILQELCLKLCYVMDGSLSVFCWHACAARSSLSDVSYSLVSHTPAQRRFIGLFAHFCTLKEAPGEAVRRLSAWRPLVCWRQGLSCGNVWRKTQETSRKHMFQWDLECSGALIHLYGTCKQRRKKHFNCSESFDINK